MRKLLQLIVFFLFFSYFAYGDSYKSKDLILLKKDKMEKILIKYDDVEKIFKFRWTLYKNGGLVVFRAYDQIVGQNILYLNHFNQSVRVELRSRGSGMAWLPYIILKFVKFDYERKEATFELYLFDKKGQIEMKFLTKEAL